MFNAKAQMKMRTYVAFVMIKDRWEWKSKLSLQSRVIEAVAEVKPQKWLKMGVDPTEPGLGGG